MSKDKESIKVSILRVREYTVGPTGGPQLTLHDILFQAPGMTPTLVTLKAEDDTPEARAKAIRKKIEDEKQHVPESMTV